MKKWQRENLPSDSRVSAHAEIRYVKMRFLTGRSLRSLSFWYESSRRQTGKSRCSSGVEHFLGKEEVMGSIPINGSTGNIRAYQKDWMNGCTAPGKEQKVTLENANSNQR
jgi:hypothetical protein